MEANVLTAFSVVLLHFVCRCESLKKLNITIDSEVVVRNDELEDCYERSDPTRTGEGPVAFMSIAILDIDQIIEDNMEFRMQCYVKVHWRNSRIIMNTDNESRPVLLPRRLSDCMWKPDIMFPNTKEITSYVDMLPNVGYKYLPNGQFYRCERFMMRVECPMMFNLYPLDTQHCFHKISLLNNPDDILKLAWYKSNSVKFVYKIEPLQFNVERPKTHSIILKWYTGNYTELWTNITFHRRLTGSLINFYIPSTLVVVLSWLSFYIDVEAAPARVSLGVTALLTIVTQTVQARSILPPVQYLTGLDVWLFACLSVVFASFIEYSVAYSFRNKPDSKSDKIKVSNVKISPNDVIKSPRSPVRFSTLEKKNIVVNSANIFDKYSRCIFPLISCLFAIAYWSYYLKVSEYLEQNVD